MQTLGLPRATPLESAQVFLVPKEEDGDVLWLERMADCLMIGQRGDMHHPWIQKHDGSMIKQAWRTGAAPYFGEKYLGAGGVHVVCINVKK